MLAVTTRPINSIEVESDLGLHLTSDEFMTSVDRDEFLEVKLANWDFRQKVN